MAPASAYQPFHMLGARRGQIWRFQPEHRHRRPRHFHNEPELNLIVAGHGRVGTGDIGFDVAAGDLLCWPPACDHELLEASADFDLYAIGILPELLARVLGCEHLGAFSAPVWVSLPAEAFGRLRALCTVSHAEVEAGVVESRVGDLWRAAHEARLGQASKIPAGRRALLSLLEGPDLSRDDRARSVRAHPSEISRLFHREIGVTLTTYRTRLRLLRFIELVDHGRRTMVQSALEAGFGSYSQCHRAFVNELACSPRRFFTTAALRAGICDAFAPLSPAPPAGHTLATAR